ncbi:MAG: AlpA family phage regulatory protein [Gallionella sp.]|nr:AlpA family phage regulatory protein [Gallionella sp.]
MKILRDGQLRKLVPLSRVTIWRLEKQDAFPRRVKIGKNSIGWLEHEVIQWIASRPKA